MKKQIFGIALIAPLLLGGIATAGADEATQDGLGLTPVSDEELSAQKGEGLDGESTDTSVATQRRRRTTDSELRTGTGPGSSITVRSGNAAQNNLTTIDATNGFSSIRNTAGGGG